MKYCKSLEEDGAAPGGVWVQEEGFLDERPWGSGIGGASKQTRSGSGRGRAGRSVSPARSVGRGAEEMGKRKGLGFRSWRS